MEPTGCAETLVQNCHSALFKIPKERNITALCVLEWLGLPSLQMPIWIVWECTRLTL